MTDERRLTIASSSRLSPEDVARHTFATSRRGFESGEVRAFLELVARELHSAVARERELLDALSEAEHLAANPVLDEATLTTALGQETANVLRTAHEAASKRMARAETEAGQVRAQAQEEADRVLARAEEHATESATKADAAAADVHRRAHEEATSRVETAKLEAEAMVSKARSECRAMVQEAQELRARVLTDLTQRRRVLHTQIEQLRAGRERLAETIGEVRHTVDRVTDDLLRAEDEARSAAEAAGRQAGQLDLDEAALDQPVPAVSEAEVTPTVTTEQPEPAVSSQPEPEEDEERRHQAVEDLFARLRAEHVPSPQDEGVKLLGPVPSTSQEASSITAETPVVEAAPGEPEEPEDKADPVLTRRDELLEPVSTGLARRLKRALADDQNAILDRLRGRQGWSDEVIGSEEDQERRYAEAAQSQLLDAGRAGATFAGGTLDDAPEVAQQALALAKAVVSPLRRRLLECGTVEDGDEGALSEHIGAAFREWKGQRTERLAADYTHSAFWESALSVLGDGTKLRWLVDDDGVQCPDCDDNALAGPLPGGEAFPTGHVHPPAHAGCRCLLVPDPA